MKRFWLKLVFGSAALLTISNAWAGDWFSNYFPIVRLDNGDANDAYRVFMGVSKNPNGCANNDYFEVYPTASAATKDLMNKTLLAALLAGRKIRLNISTTTCGASGRPAYTGVDVNSSQ